MSLRLWERGGDPPLSCPPVGGDNGGEIVCYSSAAISSVVLSQIFTILI